MPSPRAHALWLLCCCACSLVRADLIAVYVNRMLLWSELGAELLAGSVEYRYSDGDYADVRCVRWPPCELQLHFETMHAIVRANGDITQQSAGGAVSTLGARMRLLAAHDGALLTCRCRGQDLSNITLQFKHYSFDHLLDLTANSITLRYQQPCLQKSKETYSVQYAYEPGDKVECDTSASEARPDFINFITNDGRHTDNATSSETSYKYECMARDANGTEVRRVQVTYKPYCLLSEADETPLRMRTTGAVEALHLYEPRRQQLLYYDFDDGELLTLNCTTLPGVVHTYNYTLVFNKKGTTTEDSITKQLSLSIWDHGRSLECHLLHKRDNTTVRSSRMWLRLNATAARPQARGHDIRRTVSAGSSVDIVCQAAGIPKPTITWMFKSRLGTRKEIKGSANEASVASVVHIDDVGAEHEGEYTCVAHNTHGTDLFGTRLQVVWPHVNYSDSDFPESTHSEYDGPTSSGSNVTYMVPLLLVLGGVAVTAAAVWWCCARRRRDASRHAAGAGDDQVSNEMTEASIHYRHLPSASCDAPEYAEVRASHAYDEIQEAPPAPAAVGERAAYVYDYVYGGSPRPDARDAMGPPPPPPPLGEDERRHLADAPGRQNTMYYWVSTSSSASDS